jgi:hypothetical protein
MLDYNKYRKIFSNYDLTKGATNNTGNSIVYFNMKFEDVLKDFDDLLSIFLKILNSFREIDQKVDNSLLWLLLLINKFTFHVISLQKLLLGIDFTDENYTIVIKHDIPSIYILIRTLIENYLTVFYLFLQPETIIEKDFRIILFKISGIKYRLRLNPSTEFSLEQAEKDKENLKDLITEIQNNKYYIENNTHFDSMKLLKKCPSKIKSWNTLLDESGLNNKAFKSAWNMFSNYAHSEYWSLIQIKDFSINNNSISKTLVTITPMINMLCSVLILDVSKLHMKIESTYNSLSFDEKYYIESFSMIAKNNNV